MSRIGQWVNRILRREDEAPAAVPEKPRVRVVPAAKPAPKKAPQAPAPVAAPAPVSSPVKPPTMNFEDILSTIHQIEEIVGPGEAGEESTQLDAVQMPLFDMVALAPDAFNVPSGTPSDREVFEVLIEDLYEQLAQGKVVTTLQYFLAGVPPRYLATGKKLDQGRQVALPLPLVVRLIGPEQLKARSCQKRPAPKMRDMPDLFVGSKQAAKPAAPKPAAAPEPVAQEPAPAPAVSVPAPAVAAAPAPAPAPAAAPAPEPVSTRPGIMLPLSEMARILPAFFKLPEDLTAFPDIKFRVEIPDMFAKLALGKIEVRRMDFLINVPSKFLKVVDGAAGDDLIVLPLPVVVSAIAPEEWSKQMKGAPASSRPRVSAIPDLFEAKRPPAKAPAAPAQPPPAAPVEAAPVKEPPKPVVEKPAAPVVKEEKAPAPAPVEKKTPAPEVVQPAKAEVVVEKPAPAKRPEAVAPVPMEEKPAAKPSLDPEAILLRVLGERSARLPDPSEVASRWKDVEGYDGCAIIHREGDLLATSWSHKASDMLEVMAPQIWKRVAGYVDHLDEGTMKSVTVSVSNHLLTFVQSGDLCFVAMHKPGSFDHAHLELAQKLAVELGSRFVTPRREK